MAPICRTANLGKICLLTATKRTFNTNASSFQTINKSASSIISKQARSPFVKDAFPCSIRVTTFHTSGRRSILPPLPQTIDGTANDAAKVPQPSPSHGSYHWTFERLISAGLIPLTIAPFAAGSLNPATDAILCAAIIVHSHIGFESCITDYFPTKRVPKTRKALDWALKLATVAVGVGLYEFETNDVGVTEAIRRIWKA